MKLLFITLLLTSLIGYAGLAHAENTVVDLQIGEHKIHAELAATSAAQKKGLMFRTSLLDHQGMLFVYEQPTEACMWMKNTVIPLSVAFINRTGHIINIARMRPLSKKLHCSEADAFYALEMTEGWFQARGVQAGSLIAGLEAIEKK